MAKTIEFNILSQKSIKKAIKELDKYKSSLQDKCELLCEKLIQKGYERAKMTIDESKMSSRITLTTDITPETAGCKALLVATGQSIDAGDGRQFNLLLGIEFGAGIKFNSGNANPFADELGMGVGTFPKQTHAFNPNGWYYLGKDDKWHHSYGVKATMPMYKATTDILANVESVAKEVFKK